MDAAVAIKTPKPSTETQQTTITVERHLNASDSYLASTEEWAFKGKIDRSPGDILVCLGFMSLQEARAIFSLQDAIDNKKVVLESNVIGNDRFEMTGIPAIGTGENTLVAWRATNDGGFAKKYDGPIQLGSYYVDEKDLNNDATDPQGLEITSRKSLNGVETPAAPADQLRRYDVLPSFVMPNSWMLDTAKFTGNSGTVRVFAVVQRPGTPINREPAGIPYVVEAIRSSPRSDDWIARNIHTAEIEPAGAAFCQNELIMWEYRGGTNWTTYQRQFFAKRKSSS